MSDLATMPYTLADSVASLRDLIALRGQLVFIGGKSARAYVRSEGGSQVASSSGDDDFSDEKSLTFERDGLGDITAETVIKIGSRNYRANLIEPVGDALLTLTVDLP